MFKISNRNATPAILLLAPLTTLLMLLFLLTSCGINPDEPVYDTENNPEKFPHQAVSLVENVQSGQLEESSAIIDAFAELYSTNPDLLGNDEWKEVVLKLGIKLRHKADQLARKGILNYSKAAGLYHVACFARPNDTRILAMDKLFSRWQGEVSDSLVSLAATERSGNADLGIIIAEIEQLRRFQFADSLSTEFARLYLHDQLFKPLTTDRNRANAMIDSLSQSERAFLNLIGVSDRPLGNILGRFDQPKIDLVAVDLIKLSGSEYRAEVYFLPGEPISDNLTVAFWVDSPDSILSGQVGNASYFPYDFAPLEASSTWPADQISVASRRFSFDWPIKAVSVGLYSQSENDVRFLPIVSSQNTPMGADSIAGGETDEPSRGSSNLIRVTLEPVPGD